MHHTDIDLNRTSAEGARLLREYLDYAENGAVALERSISVGAYEQFDSDFELEVCEFLRSRGFSVDTQVGCSGFKIDLGLKLPDSSDYVLAIECDGATYHSSKNARDRDRLRQAILERMGWKFYRIWSTDWFRNKEVEKERLLTAAIDAVKHPDRKKSNPSEAQPEVSFEETMSEAHFNFLPYRAVNVQHICKKHPRQVKAIVREILEYEAPLSEELLLRRMSWYYGREKVTNVVWRAFEEDMEGCERYGIIRANGFLYLSEEHPIVFRRPGNLQREIKHIGPEELAAGMLDILHLNGTVEKSSLCRLLATQCGFARGGKNIQEYMDAALEVLEDRIHINDDQISLK
jgi:very-short-patch-repair endonuclease